MISYIHVAQQSTCQKRVTLCVIYDRNGRVLAADSNRCAPPDGVCQRLGVVQQKENYSTESCNWEHAEARAVAYAMKYARSAPHRAVLYGHDFICDACENALKSIGVVEFDIIPEAPGCGLRP